MSFVVHGERGEITVTSSALASIVTRAATQTPGVRVRRRRRHLDTRIADGHASVSLQLTAAYGLVLPDVARRVQSDVHDAVATMCDVEVDAVDVVVEDID